MTTLELPPDLVKRARIFAAEHGLPLRALVEQALRDFLARKERQRCEEMDESFRRRGAGSGTWPTTSTDGR